MFTQQLRLVDSQWNNEVNVEISNCSQVLMIVMGDLCANEDALRKLRKLIPQAQMVGATTSGEFLNDGLEDNGLSATLIGFRCTQIRATAKLIETPQDSYDTGASIASELNADDLQLILVLSDGLEVFGSDLTRGLTENCHDSVAITGGLAGDDSKFEKTYTLLNDSVVSKQIVAVGLCGENLSVSHASRGGWTPFGPERLVTASQGHELLELDHQPALDVYKSYLGDLVDQLPGIGLRYPLEILQPGSDTKLVRTMLAIDESRQSITFAGGIPKGSTARLMRANVDAIIDGAAGAIQICTEQLAEPQLALLVSCVGRKQILKQMADEELEVVRDALPATTMICGFYSYGEICPTDNCHRAELHNQTMTITCISELGCTDC